MTYQGFENIPLLFFVLVAMTFIWLALAVVLHRRISTKHLLAFDRMGRPGVFLSRNGKPSHALLKFIALREHRSLGDRFLSILSDAMIVYYLGLMGIAAALVFGHGGTSA